MRRAAAVVLALVVVGGLVALVSSGRDGGESRPPVVAPDPSPSPRLLVGFLDDANFRWRPYRARMLDRAQRTGARVVRAFIRWHLTAPTEPQTGQPPFVEPMLYEIDELVANANARGMEVMFSIWGTPG